MNKKKQQPNERPGPGAAYTFFSISNSNLKKLQQKERNRDSPPYQTWLRCTLQSQLNSSSLYLEDGDTDASPLVKNGSLPMENSDKCAGDSEKSL